MVDRKQFTVDFIRYSVAHDAHVVQYHVIANQLWFVCETCDVSQGQDSVAAGLPVIFRNVDGELEGTEAVVEEEKS